MAPADALVKAASAISPSTPSRSRSRTARASDGAADREGIPVCLATAADATDLRVEGGDRLGLGCEGRRRRDLDRVGAPQLAVAPGARGRVELGDPIGDVLAGGQGRVREAAHELVHVHDVGMLGDRLPAVDVVLGRSVQRHAVVEQPLGEPVRLGLAALAVLEAEWLAAGLMPLGITKALGYGTIQSWFSASKPRSARNGSSQHATRGALVTLRIAIVSWSWRMSPRLASQ